MNTPVPDAWQVLQTAISLFDEWASSISPGDRYGEWECDYQNWPSLSSAFETFLDSCPYSSWDREQITALVSIIARDNEREYLIGKLAKDTDRLLFLSEAALKQGPELPERDFSFQLATALGKQEKHLSEVEPYLLMLFNHTDELVQRYALMALARVQSPQVDSLATKLWDTPDEMQEYSRMGVLYALCKTASPLLPCYLALAEADGRNYLVAYAGRIRRGEC